MQNITSVDGELWIYDNDELAYIDGLENIESSSIIDLHIYNNPQLSQCDISNICAYLLDPLGEVNIYDNAPGCNSPEEVEEACDNSCLPEGILFFNQQQIDDFQANYPGCTVIEGDVSILGSHIENLYGLDVLNSIEGDLQISGNDDLTNLNGLSDLNSIGGTLNIHSNSALTDITALDNLSSIGGNLIIEGNDVLCNCEAEGICNYLFSPNGTIDIYDNAPGCNNPPDIASACGITLPCLPYGNYYFFTQAEIDNFQTNYPDCSEIEGNVKIIGDDITNLEGLSVLTAIGGDLLIGSYFEGGNPNLQSLVGLDNVTSIEGDLVFYRNNALTSLSGPVNLVFIGGKLWIEDNNALTSLSGLDNVTSIGGDLWVYDNDSLISLTGLDNVTFIGGVLGIKVNPALTSLTGLGNVTSIWSDLWIIGNNSLTSLSGPDNLAFIGGNLVIEENNALTSLSGFENVTSIGGDLWVYDNDSLISLTGLDNVTSIAGVLKIRDNIALSSLTGLDNVTSIWSDLWVINNNSLTSLSGLDNLTSVGGHLVIVQNDALTSITSLDNLISIGGGLSIDSNDALTSLTGLENIDASSITNLHILHNSSLSTCDVQSICDYLTAPSGNIEIRDNATGCNSPEEVIEACDSIIMVEEVIKEEMLMISPNPCSSLITIRLTMNDRGFVIVDLLEMSGINIRKLVNEMKMPGTHIMEFDLGDIPAGVYFCVLKTNEGIQTRKIIKL